MAVFTGKEKHDITLKKARTLVKAFRKNKAKSEIGAYYFGKEAIAKILAQRGCVGLRLYHAKKPTGVKTLIVVGADKNGNDMVHGRLAEFGYPCPPFCPPDEKLAD